MKVKAFGKFKVGQRVRVLRDPIPVDGVVVEDYFAQCKPVEEIVGLIGKIEVLEEYQSVAMPDAYVRFPDGSATYLDLCYLQPFVPQKLTPQCSLLLKHMQKGKSVTQRSALMDFGVMALPRRIADLREAGYEIVSVMETNKFTGQRYARYYMEGSA